MTKKKLRKQFKRFSNKTEQPLKLFSGALGIYIGGHQYVDVPTRPGFVYVRLLNNTSELIQAHNQTVSPVYDLPVLVVRMNNRYEIYSRDTAQYGSYWTDTSSYLPRHGAQHSFDPDNNGGGDLVFVHGEQFYPMMTFPSGTDGAGNVLIAPYRYFHNSQWYYTGNTGTSDLLQYRPTGSANAKLILIGITEDTGNPFVKTGVEFSAAITGAAELTNYVPTNITLGEELPGAIIRLVTGTQTITWANIYDARQYMGILAESSSFLALNDTPNSYSGQANKVVTVKPDESGLEFVTSVTGSTGGGFVDGIQETWFPTILSSTYTGTTTHQMSGYTYVPYSGTYRQLAFAPGDGLTTLTSLPISVGNDKLAFVWATNSTYDLKNWLLRGEYSLALVMARQVSSHAMSAYCQLFYRYGDTERLVASSDLAEAFDGVTAIDDDSFGLYLTYLFRFNLLTTAFTDNGPIQRLSNSSPEQLVLKIFVNASAGGSDGYLAVAPNSLDFLNVNLQRQVLNNHYFPITGTFLQLYDTPDSYAGQGSKYVAVKSTADGIEFVNSPGGGGGSGVVVYDDSVYKVTGTSISFDSGLDVAVTGSTAFVNSSAPVLIGTSSPSGTNTVTFSNIPATYNHLEVVFVARSTRASQVFDEINLWFNNDTTAANYREIRNYGYGASTEGASGGDNTLLGDIPAASSPSNSAAIFMCKIPFYTLTTFNKQMLASHTSREDASSVHEAVYHIGMEWEATTAINRLDFVLINANYVYGSKFYLYGVV